MGQQVGHDVAVHAVSDHDDAHDDKDIAHDPAGQFDADQHAHDGHPLIHQVFSPGAVIDGLEIVHPVADGHNRCHNEKVVHRAHDLALGLIEQKAQDVGDNDVDAPVILGGRRFDHGRPRIIQHQKNGQDIENDFFIAFQFIVHGGLPIRRGGG